MRSPIENFNFQLSIIILEFFARNLSFLIFYAEMTLTIYLIAEIEGWRRYIAPFCLFKVWYRRLLLFKVIRNSFLNFLLESFILKVEWHVREAHLDSDLILAEAGEAANAVLFGTVQKHHLNY
jgi:hypothetical protein